MQPLAGVPLRGYAVGLKPFGGLRFNFSIARPEEPGIVRLKAVSVPAGERLRGPLEGFERAGLKLAFYLRSQVLERHRIGVTPGLLGYGSEVIGMVAAVSGRPWAVEFSCTTHFTDDRAYATTTVREKSGPSRTSLPSVTRGSSPKSCARGTARTWPGWKRLRGSTGKA